MTNNQRFSLAILETSDVHGNVFPINYGLNAESPVGLGKIAALIQQERNKHEHTLVIDNGDVIQGTPLTYHFARYLDGKPNPMIQILNHLGYDAAVFGNHEFNYGLELLHKSINESSFPWLSANLLNKETGEPFFGKPYLIKEYENGPKVGVLGLTTHYIPNWEKEEHIEGIEFEDCLQSAKKWVNFLKNEEKVDLLIVSYHGGFERDLETGEPTEVLTTENQGYQMCQEIDGMDILLTGHQHRFISGESVNGVLVVQPGSQGRALGKASVEMVKEDGNWRVAEKSSQLLYTEEVEADEQVLEMVKDYEEATQKWLDQPIGKIKGDMEVRDPMKIRTGDHPLIEFFNRVQMEATNADISSTALFDNLAPGLKSDVTMRDVVANYIYPNTLKVIRVKGKDIKEALEQSASYFAPYNGEEIEVNPKFLYPKPEHYNYDMWEGIDYEINISKPFGERITKLEYKGDPLEMNREYDVVMNNYRSGGGGNYLMFKDKPVIVDLPMDVSELIANYILERKEIEATVDYNWRVVHE
ncbi:bifunctional metallophosphatase/5'-nucleotidase [Falsibacillus albus]|uniref:Bifunctional metallophosphatase/5'-nucleotidase n=1 Tax=Falsibacillus albus TaxID=2478915 RepID=A0A3L7JTB4_9BACI|nr:bifunctional UDP-sugar hydrolase/5'-nucleotidase [Falsibacillus albus]RLQ94088.1 bifunctional metallophosphatase/5'-nucleotidase [Falsibacillus albus]